MSQKVAYVTGGMGGIGTAICQRLHRDGFKVIAGCGPTRDYAKWLAEQKALGYTFHASVGNVADWDSTVAAFSKAKAEHGTIDVLVNNAGITRDKTFMKMTHVEWDEVVGVNLKGPVQMTHLYLPQMVERGWGRVINITSVIGQMGNFGQANYAAAKGGLDAFTKSVAREVARKGVTVNCVAPGFIRTDMTAGVPEKALEHIKTITPMGRMGEAEEIAEVVSFLASPSASFVTGQEIGVNGGLYM